MSIVINLDNELDLWRSQVEDDIAAGRLEDSDFSDDVDVDAWPDDDAGVDAWPDDDVGVDAWPDDDVAAWPDDDSGAAAWPDDDMI